MAGVIVAQLKYKTRPKRRAQSRTVTINSTSFTLTGDWFAFKTSANAISTLATAVSAKKIVHGSVQILRMNTGKSTKMSRRVSRFQMLAHSEGFAAVQPREIDELRTESGTRYPLRHPLDVVLRAIGNSARAYIPEVDVLGTIIGEGRNFKSALSNFTAGFHRLVETHWRKPPHLQTGDDEAINRILDNLIDWEQFRRINPIEQPLWGRLQQWMPGGGARIQWFIGPDEERNKESYIKAKDVCEALRDVPVESWFYGAAKVYPNRIKWTQLPVEVPDPKDPDAIRQAWDLIPRHVISEANAWPLHNKG